jgi:hypothetical protein
MKEVSAALVRAQKAFGPALKSHTNPAFKSKYADLSACVEAVVDALNANGIALMQRNIECESGICVETVFIHESGETLSSGPLHVPATKQDAQGYGSALTYARRYSLMAACGIAPEDDDGNAAAKAKPAAERATQPSHDRTLVMKATRAIREHIANDRSMGAISEWDAVCDMGDDFRKDVWAGLTTPERDYIRANRTEPKKAA